MKARLLARYAADGSVRSIWRDEQQPRAHGVKPLRASRIEVIETGPLAGFFFTTILLAPVTGNPAHEVSLYPPLASYADSLRREIAWLEHNYVLEEAEETNGVSTRGDDGPGDLATGGDELRHVPAPEQ